MFERRSSARIQKLNSERSLSGCKESKYKEVEPEREKKKSVKRKRIEKPKAGSKIEETVQVKAPSEAVESNGGEVVEAAVEDVVPAAEPETNGNENEGGSRSAYAVVRAAVRSFYTHYLHFVQVWFLYFVVFSICLFRSFI